jgi:hypothetical protein
VCQPPLKALWRLADVGDGRVDLLGVEQAADAEAVEKRRLRPGTHVCDL